MATAAPQQPSTLIIGAGIAGLACAHQLDRAGLPYTLLDKGRGAGGRTSTRRTDAGPFDHGAPFFHATSAAFHEALSRWQAAGVAGPWGPSTEGPSTEGPSTEGPRYVGLPAMNAITKWDAQRLGAQFGRQVTKLTPAPEGGWIASVADQPDMGADQLVIATPAEQAAILLGEVAPPLARAAATAQSAPCWTVMVAFDSPIDAEEDLRSAASDPTQGNPIGLAVRDSAKPGRPNGERWVLHATPGWSEAHLEETPAQICDALLEAFRPQIGTASKVLHATAHRWRYGLVATPAMLGTSYLIDKAGKIGVCGDWLRGPTVEDGWTSGDALGAALAKSATNQRTH